METDPRLIQAFFHLWESPHPHKHLHEHDPDQKLVDGLDLMISQAPEEAWPIILELVDQAPDGHGLEMVAVSLIESLLVDHGVRFIERVEEQIRRSPRFRQAMLSCWYMSLPDWEIQERLRRLLHPPDPPIDPPKTKRAGKEWRREIPR